MKSKWRNYRMWVSLTAAVLLGVQTVGVIFGLQLAPEKYDQVTAAINAVLGVLVVLGIVSNPEVGKGYMDKE
ncbi:phage holin [Paenibacillus sp. FSL R7-269]|uniref:phage holin n=1 Tax=Paenibacillus sp. FSL R7-269 TaxID=1226755 RepID=UPI000566612D|nr:phage holin [Paenibacillus sp. FSL R7-269]